MVNLLIIVWFAIGFLTWVVVVYLSKEIRVKDFLLLLMLTTLGLISVIIIGFIYLNEYGIWDKTVFKFK